MQLVGAARVHALELGLHDTNTIDRFRVSQERGLYTPGEGREIIDAEIEHSVVLERSRIVGVHRIQDSLLGREVEVLRSQLRPQASRLMLGDHSRIELE